MFTKLLIKKTHISVLNIHCFYSIIMVTHKFFYQINILIGFWYRQFFFFNSEKKYQSIFCIGRD